MIESGFINGDCMDYLKEYPDNYFDLCIADPPYGDAMKSGGGWNRFGQRFNRYKTDTLPFGLRKKDRNYKNRRNMGDKIRKKKL